MSARTDQSGVSDSFARMDTAALAAADRAHLRHPFTRQRA